MRLTARGLKGYATDPLAISWKQGVPEALVAAEGREVRLRAVALASDALATALQVSFCVYIYIYIYIDK
jgi:hypothetical protein